MNYSKFYQSILTPTLSMVILMSLCSCTYSQDSSKPAPQLKLSDVILFARRHFPDEPRKYSNSQVSKNFDFASLKPSGTPGGVIESVKLFFSGDEIVKVRTVSRFTDSDFEFWFVRNDSDNYTIFFGEQIYDTKFENEQGDVVNGFFLCYGGKTYFIGFEGPQCIIELNTELKAIKTLKFDSDSLTYKTVVKYRNQDHLYSDVFYSPKKPTKISDNTTMADIEELFSSADFTYFKEVVIGWVKEDDHLPLWIFGGRHEYDWSRKP